MPATPFVQKALESAGLLNKFLGTERKGNALLELNNALAQAQNVREVTLETVEQLNSTYAVDIHSQFRAELNNLYRRFLLHCLEDRQFSHEEVEDLWHLKALLGVSDSDHETLYQEAALATYRKTFEEVLADSTVTQIERDNLERLSAYLGIPEDTRKATFAAIAQDFLQSQATLYFADKQLSPEEENELGTLARSLGATIEYGSSSIEDLNRMRYMWHINNSPLPVITVPINLPRGEACHFQCPGELHEHRKVTRRVDYSGPSLRLKICKGVYWNAGRMAVNRISQDVLTKIDSGTAYLTSKRVIFNGSIKSQSIKLARILDITRYADAVRIEKDGGKSPVLMVPSPEIFGAMLARLIRDSG